MDEQMIEKRYWQNAQYQRAIHTGIWLGKRINRLQALLHHGHAKPPAGPIRPRHA
ncbi:MAG: hypothetical protein OES46_10850 [Gammaproteobacteria bacterium]|jgi:hypothetical protein|nr:hypothetical protein [Gammaproteobacteria bacterium]